MENAHALQMRFFAITLLLGLPFLAACSSSEPLPTADFGQALDAFGEEGPVLELIDGLPASFLVGDADQVDSLLAIRSNLSGPESETNTLIQCSALSQLSFAGLADEMLEAALEDGGPILLDRNGSTCNSLRQGLPGIHWITVAEDGSILTSKEM